jgi:hypothetical protein
MLALVLLLRLAADAGTPAVVERREEPYEIFVTVRPPEAPCPALEWRRKSRQLRLRLCPGKRLAEQAASLAGSMARLRAEEGAVVADGSLVMSLDYLGYPEYVLRLARHAAAAKDRKPGQSINAYVAGATTEKMIEEVAAIFAPLGRKPVVASAEKCSEARPAGKSEMSAWLREKGFRGSNPLPMGCAMVWIELR